MPKASIEKEGILRGLRALGVSQGNILEVHSSLSAIGTVEGGAEAVVEALIEVVSAEGTIVMSAYPVGPAVPLTSDDRERGIMWKVRKLPEGSTEKTGMGSVSDVFRKHTDTKCGTGLHRNCAWGANAERYKHNYRAFIEDGGWCLLLGVGFDRCSSMHVPEGTPLPPEIEACWAVPNHIHREYDPSLWDIGYGGTPGDAWQKVWQRAQTEGLVRHGQIGLAASHFFKVQPIADIYANWRKLDPHGLYEVPKVNLHR